MALANAVAPLLSLAGRLRQGVAPGLPSPNPWMASRNAGHINRDIARLQLHQAGRIGGDSGIRHLRPNLDSLPFNLYRIASDRLFGWTA